MPDYKVCVWGREICSIFVVKEEKQFSDTTSNGGRVGSKTRRNTMRSQFVTSKEGRGGRRYICQLLQCQP